MNRAVEVLSDHALTKGIKTKTSQAHSYHVTVLSDHALTKGIKTIFCMYISISACVLSDHALTKGIKTGKFLHFACASSSCWTTP